MRRVPAWLTPERARLYVLLLALPVLAVFVGLVWRLFGLASPEGLPGPTDFLAFWSAGRLAALGQPWLAYDGAALAAVEQSVVGPLPGDGVLSFIHPPPLLLFLTPLGALGYPLAATLWLGLTGAAAMALTARLLAPPLGLGLGLLVALAFPAHAVNIQFAQMGFLILALYGAAALTLSSRPWIAGTCIGLLALKPQLALLAPVALAAAARWPAFAAATFTLAAMVTLPALAFGPEIWPSFLDALRAAAQALQEGGQRAGQMQSLAAVLRRAGLGDAAALALQAALALAVAALLFRALRRRPGGRAEMAALAAAAPLATPYLLVYDLVLLALPTAWLVAAGLRHGFRPWEAAAILAILPLAALAGPALAMAGLPAGLLAAGLALHLVLRRCASAAE